MRMKARRNIPLLAFSLLGKNPISLIPIKIIRKKKKMLKKINDEIIEDVTERQKKLEELCNEFNNNINKLVGRTNSPIILSMLASLSVLMTVVKDNLDFTRSGFDLFLDEIKNLNQRIEKYHGDMDSAKKS